MRKYIIIFFAGLFGSVVACSGSSSSNPGGGNGGNGGHGGTGPASNCASRCGSIASQCHSDSSYCSQICSQITEKQLECIEGAGCDQKQANVCLQDSNTGDHGGNADGGSHGSQGGADAAPPNQTDSSFRIKVGDHEESGDGVHFYFDPDPANWRITSDASIIPNIDIEIHNQNLSVGTYPCVRRDNTTNNADTAVLAQLADGHRYYTNLFRSPQCTIEITSASQASVSGTVSGKIYNEDASSDPPLDFSGSFTASLSK